MFHGNTLFVAHVSRPAAIERCETNAAETMFTCIGTQRDGKRNINGSIKRCSTTRGYRITPSTDGHRVSDVSERGACMSETLLMLPGRHSSSRTGSNEAHVSGRCASYGDGRKYPPRTTARIVLGCEFLSKITTHPMCLNGSPRNKVMRMSFGGREKPSGCIGTEGDEQTSYRQFTRIDTGETACSRAGYASTSWSGCL